MTPPEAAREHFTLVACGTRLPRENVVVVNRWDEKASLRRDAVRSQIIDVLEAQEIKETGNEER
jgi:hypothetical protein